MSPQGGGMFPFGDDVADNCAIAHLRNFSNYLLPRGRGTVRDMAEFAAVALRGQANRRGRGADFFMFCPGFHRQRSHAVSADASAFRGDENDGAGGSAPRQATAVAISAAAISANTVRLHTGSGETHRRSSTLQQG